MVRVQAADLTVSALWLQGSVLEPYEVRTPRQDPSTLPSWVHWGVTVVLLVLVAAIDISRPWHRDFSLLYLLAVLYAGWTTSPRSMVAAALLCSVTVFLAPALWAPDLLSPGGTRNRIFGVIVGLLMTGLLWDRRRFALELQSANRELERRVAARTAELDGANRSLREEIQNRERTEAGLREAQRLEAIGRLAGGIAHDFNNLLTIILGYADLLQAEGRADESTRYSAEQIALAGRKAADLTQKLLAFSRRQVLQVSVFNLNDVLRGLDGLLRRLLPENIRITLHLDPAVQPIRADRVALEQAVLNLAANARDAMPGGGDFGLATSHMVVSAEAGGMPAGPQPGAYLRLMVTDTGCGMDETTRNHVFEPFFTTKEVGKGTGLGLASVHGVIKQSGGHIEVSSEVGRGTTFTILLPCVVDAPRLPDAHAASRTAAPGTETILLVEDDHSVRRLSSLILQRAGYSVLSAADGADAIELMQRHAGPIHLLITDAIMPRISGSELAQTFARERPSTVVLFVSGHAPEALLSGARTFPQLNVLAKPYTADELLAKVVELLREGRKAPPASR
jgi:two-component system cell cycle sensor histidine kinase/response regulator CckA